ncbi:DUF58 domain-containing protein [Bavariicoccus seileri]|uniref:DUF58 domain-containing protein n=1 Tax=Bavariicoccus seileri TaxID=549685 RepID=UPI0003B77E13|nr:DUF58 domain-containing protein [Bavariicoccus seileri]
MRKFGYLLTLVLSFYLSGRYHSAEFMVLAIVLFVLLFISYLYALQMAKYLEIEIDLDDPIIVKEHTAIARIRLTNRQRLPIPYYQITVSFYNRLDPNKKVVTKKFHGFVDGLGEATIALGTDSTYSGEIEILVTEIECFDYLKLFKRRKRLAISQKQIVIPPVLKADLALLLLQQAGSKGQEVDLRGATPPNVFQVRQYEAGDHLKTIHWKLSARNDELLSKVYSEQKEEQVSIRVDLTPPLSQSLKEKDAFLVLVASLVSALTQEELVEQLQLVNKRNDWELTIPIKSPFYYDSFLQEVIHEMASIDTDKEGRQADSQQTSRHDPGFDPVDSRSDDKILITIDRQLRLYENHQLLYQFEASKLYAELVGRPLRL